MLLAFLKYPSEETADCQIIKYVDRIFLRPRLMSRKTPLTVVRSFCIEVSDASPVPIHGITMVCPRGLTKVEDISQRLIENNVLTKAATKYGVISENQRAINWDGLPSPVRVARRLSFHNDPGGNYTLLAIGFNEPLAPGERLAIAVRIEYVDRISKPSFFRRGLKLQYFLGPAEQEAELVALLSSAREVKCLTYHSGNPSASRVNGGFDVMVNHPRHLKLVAQPAPTTVPSIVLRDADMKTLKTPLTQQVWRLRNITNDRIIGCKTHDFDITLDMEFPSTWPMFFFSVATSATVAILIGVLLAPWLRKLIWGLKAP